MNKQDPAPDQETIRSESSDAAPSSGGNRAPARREAAAEPPEELTRLGVREPGTKAAGMPAVASSLKHVYRQAGVSRGTKTLLNLNQTGGFDCPSCAWPDPDDERSPVEFCENGAKAVASEATKRRIGRDFFARYTVQELAEESDYWMDQQGRLTEPMVLREGESNYRPISWDDAFALIAEELNSLDSPDEAAFYTSGRASNEAAFLYQLFVRQYGTNNMPDCSNMCHESSGSALKASVGVGKGTVTLDDIYEADTILIIGQNPGTNHPRMLSALQRSVDNGAKIIAVNPLRETGLVSFAHPQHVKGLLGVATPLASQYLQIRVGGDQAFLQGVGKALFELDEKKPGVVDKAFVERFTEGMANWEAAVKALDWAEVEQATGLKREAVVQVAEQLAESPKIITCWAMGLTQHKNSVATIQEIANIHLLRGAVGIPGGGLCPVRGHSNVQGDRTVGIYEKPPAEFLDSLQKVFGFEPPRHHGFDTVQAIQAMHDGRVKVFFALGGNFLSATPDTEYTADALRNCRLTVQVSTKLNRAHLVTGRQALILPCLGRTERDSQAAGLQFVTVENSMGVVHQSRGKLSPASGELLSEPAIVAGVAKATLGGRSSVDWDFYIADYDRIRDKIEEVLPGFTDYNRRVRTPGGFYLPNTAKERDFSPTGGKAQFATHPLYWPKLENGQLLLMTIRSHDQFNTTIYGMHDRYRGISNERRVVFLNKEDMAERGIKAEQPVDLIGHYEGETRVARMFLAIPYDIPRDCAAAYFPETNVLVPVRSTADVSNTPTSKSVVITVEPSTATARRANGR